MRDVKMGLTIEEAAEMTGIGRNTDAASWGALCTADFRARGGLADIWVASAGASA